MNVYPLVHGIHPHPEAIRQAMLTMSAGLDLHSTPITVDMGVTHVQQEPCETICCHAGMYALGKALLEGTVVVPSNNRDLELWETGLVARTVGQELDYLYLSFMDGVNQLATDLGFSNNLDLENWARYFTSLWNSDYGREMFSQARAFYSPDDLGNPCRFLTITSERIISWWFDVADRVERFMKEYGEDQELDEEQYLKSIDEYRTSGFFPAE